MDNIFKTQHFTSTPSAITTVLLSSILFLQVLISPATAVAITPYVKPPLQPRSIGSLIRTDLRSDVNPALSRRCRLGLYYIQTRNDQDLGSNQNDRVPDWEGVVINSGWGLGTLLLWGYVTSPAPMQDSTCLNIKTDIEPALAEKVDAYYIAGWCSFSQERHRSVGSDSPFWFQRVQKKVKSFLCVQDLPVISAPSCKLTWGNGGDQRPVYNEIDMANGVNLTISMEYRYNANEGTGLRFCETVSVHPLFQDVGVILSS
ncbi:hypothetical protein TWF506_002446 [Arthrobotrys conoides]|uniref:Uncharacterized protein n=1 Tax=Arthrobotrys conoides TaxID=74498 RepID=A0AAN8NF18_9PEZI